MHLIPWPGPQAMRWINKFLEPGPRDMQSSPVLMELSVMDIPEEDWIWMPSVLGLQLGALMFSFLSVIFSQPSIAMWKYRLFNDFNLLTTTLLDSMNVTDCIINYKCIKENVILICKTHKLIPYKREMREILGMHECASFQIFLL